MTSRLFVLLLVIFCPVLSGQNTNPVQEITRYISNNIPIDNQNWGICRNSRNGMVYFANSGGLAEYNGISLKMYRLPFRQGIRSVLVSADGRIFTGAFEEFGYWRDTTGGKLVYKSLSQNVEIEKNDEIWKIYESKGKIFFQSFTTIYCYNNDRVSIMKTPFTMLFLFKTGEKFICQGLGGGLYWFDGEKFDFIKGSEIFQWIKVHSVIRSSGSGLWICTANNGIYLYDGAAFRYFNSPISKFLIEQTCNAGLAVHDSLFVFGTISKGIVICDKRGSIINSYSYANGLKNNTVLSLYKDDRNGIWIGLDDGANYINLFSAKTLYANSSGNLGTIYTIIRDSDKLYMGTNHGLFEASIKQENEVYNFSDIKLIPRTQGQVWTLEKYDDQIICGHNEGTFLLDRGIFRKISDVTGGWSLKKFNDLLIEGTYTGIVFFKKDSSGKWAFRNKIKNFTEPIRHIEIDYRGFIWASHPQKGIYRLELNESLDSVIRAEYFSSAGSKSSGIDLYKVNNQIVFTTSDSIFTFDYENLKIMPFMQLNQTLGDYNASAQILPETKNNYWFIKGNRVALFEISKDFTATKQLELSQKFSYLPERQFQFARLSDKTILIPTRQAFITYNLPLTMENADSGRLIIRKLLFQGKRRSFESDAHPVRPIRMPYNSNNLTVHFVDPADFENENKSYLYRLKEIEENWHTTDADNFTYLNLPYGNYHLEVKSETSRSYDKVSFNIKRPWYITRLAFLFYLAVSGAIISFIILRTKSRTNRQRQLIEFEVSNNKLASELDFKSYELMLTMRYLIQKNEILNKLKDEINSLKTQSSKFPVKFIREMEKTISLGHSQTEEWKNALNSLKLTQQGFFKHLIERHPNLTPNDLRLCSYLRMNFTTKEIARLLNISERAVEISRYRLRRKMNLDHRINLTEYLIKETD